MIPSIDFSSLDFENNDLQKIEKIKEVFDNANIISIGESAHFIKEFNEIRIFLVKILIENYNLRHIALECSHLQAKEINSYLNNDKSDLLKYVGILTASLYGSFLLWLKDYTYKNKIRIIIIGIDLPNTLNPQKEICALEKLVRKSGFPYLKILEEINNLSKNITGESAVSSTNYWNKISKNKQEKLFSLILELELRIKVLQPIVKPYYYKNMIYLIETIKYILLNLKSMAALFSGTAIEGETSLRDYFMAQSVQYWVTDQPKLKLLILAHNNHIQKTVVSFEGEMTAISMGQYLSNNIRYKAIALTHLDKEIPEMHYPSNNILGFSLKKIKSSSIDEKSIENFILRTTECDKTVYLKLDDKTENIRHIRSQSAQIITELNNAFDAVICVPSIKMDKICEEIFNQI